MNYENQITLPKERIAVLIGKSGETKKQIENETGTNLTIDSKTGTVTITRTEETDSLLGIKALDIVKAVACGFAPEKAFKLLGHNTYIDFVDLEDTKDLHRVKSRVIGTDGKARKYIEQTTKTKVSIGEKTIGILGDPEGIAIAKEAILKLVEGSPHSNVFRYLEKNKR